MRSWLVREDGFTLIELMVVVLIIAILIAIAIPTFLGARQRAQDRAAQSSLRNALTSAKTIFTDNQNYLNADQTAMASAEPSLTFVDGATASTGANNISVDPIDANTWSATAKSASGSCFYIEDASGGATPGTHYGKDTTGTNCKGTDAASASAVSW
jgi:type IV pilus assembly protein PilA